MQECFASHVVFEYFTKKKLSELGYHFDSSSLPAWKAEAFMIISGKIDNVKALHRKKEQDKMKAKSRRGRRG